MSGIGSVEELREMLSLDETSMQQRELWEFTCTTVFSGNLSNPDEVADMKQMVALAADAVRIDPEQAWRFPALIPFLRTPQQVEGVLMVAGVVGLRTRDLEDLAEQRKAALR